MKKSICEEMYIYWIILLQVIGLVIFLKFSLPLSLRLDESQTLWQTSFSVRELIVSLSQNVHVPLYHLSIHVIQSLFGNEIVVGRLYSYIFYALSLPVFYVLGSYLYNRKTALFATTLYGVSPFLVWFSSETRMYTLLILLTSVSHFFFIRLMREPAKITWVAYALCALMGIYTHYFFFLVLLSHAAFYFITRKNNFTQGQFLPLFITAVGLALAFLPWVLKVLDGRGVGDSKPVLEVPTSIDFFNVFSNFFFGFQTDPVNSILLSLWPILLVLLFLALNKKDAYKTETVFLLVATSVPLFVAYVISVVYQPLFLSRYLIVILPAVFLLTARVAETYSSRISHIFKFVLLALMLVCLGIQLQSRDTPVREDYEGASNYLTTHAQGEDIIVASAPFSIYPILYYYKGEAAVRTLPLWNRISDATIPAFNPETLEEDVKTLAGSHERLYLVLSYDQGYEATLKDFFDRKFEREETVQFSRDVKVHVYRLRYDMQYDIRN